MSSSANPDERFSDIESVLAQLSNSQRHLLTAQVLMNDRLSRAEALIEQLADQGLKTNERLDRLSEKVQALADSQKHTDSNIEALTEMLRQLIERNGNGRAGH